jgi:LuxR family transcriptional regulator, maltose regulon positive regulatory protein
MMGKTSHAPVDGGSPISGLPRSRTGQIDRPRLYAILDQAATGELTIVRAGAGGGKTALITTWLERVDVPFARGAYIDLGNDASTLEAVAQALCECDGVSGDGAVHSPRELMRRAIESTVQPYLLVLDGYRGAGLDDEIAWLISNTRGLHVVLLTREPTQLEGLGPAIGARVGFVGPADLLFRNDEVADLATLLAVDCSRATIDRVMSSTAGWPVFVRDSLDVATGSDHVYESMLAAVTRSDAYRRQMLEHLSVAGGITPGVITRMCALSDEAARELVSAIESAGLGWRHDLNAEQITLIPALRRYLQADLAPDTVMQLRVSLIDIYAADEDPLSVAAMLLRLGNSQAAEAALVKCWCQTAVQENSELDEALDLPREAGGVLDQVAEIRGRARPPRASAETVRSLRSAEERYPESAALLRCLRMMELRRIGRQHEAMMISRQFVSNRSLEMDGSGVEAWMWAEHAKTLHLAGSPAARPAVGEALACAERAGDPWTRVSVVLLVFPVLWERGEIREADKWLQVVETVRNDIRSSLCAAAVTRIEISRGLLAVEDIDIDGLRESAHLVDGQQGMLVDDWSRTLLQSLSVGVTQQLSSAAVRIADLLGTHPYRRTNVPVASMLARLGATIYASLGKAHRAEQLAGQLSVRAPSDAALMARIALARGNVRRCLEIATRIVWRESIDPRTRIDLLLLNAVALHRYGRDEGAARDFRSAIGLAEHHHLRTPFLMVPRDDLLEISRASSTSMPQWLVSMPVVVANAQSVHLTQREILVLRHLQVTASIVKIANALDVSPNTVKTQLRSAYRKLEVSSREEAIVLAVELELIGDVSVEDRFSEEKNVDAPPVSSR